MSPRANSWLDANHRYLSAALAVVREKLEEHGPADATAGDKQHTAQAALKEAAAAMPSPSALDLLCVNFGLSDFERDILLLSAGVEMDSAFGPLCAKACGDPVRPYPTFSLALAALPGAHWTALSPNAPLRHWRLIEVSGGGPLTQGALRIDERVLHYLAGVQYLEDRLAGVVEPVRQSAQVAAPHQDIVDRLQAIWPPADSQELPVVQLYGSDGASNRAAAVSVCRAMGLNPYLLPAQLLPLVPGELDVFLRLWLRETLLSRSALLVDCEELESTDAARSQAVQKLVANLGGVVIVCGRDQRAFRGRPVVALEVRKPSAAHQRDVWRWALGDAAGRLDGGSEALVSQFNLSASSIEAACTQVLGQRAPANAGVGSSEDLRNSLWDACRRQARPRLEELAQRLEPVSGWEDLVLPEALKISLSEILLHVRRRRQVYETWGFASKSSRGLGISVLFAGSSGTGKTMAAEVLANELRLDLFRIDLSQVVSKYIGETEKNLRRVFDAAEDGGAVLLFDEADALFGKRSEVKDSHDRYANIEISYLLQRMESYRGLAILTTNLKDAMDRAFLRRIRFVLQFPFPNAEQRAQIWRGVFPGDTPTDGLDFEKLAKLHVAGGNIRNIALHAAFLAADSGSPVRMPHLRQAARGEFVKIEKPFVDAETGDWV